MFLAVFCRKVDKKSPNVSIRGVLIKGVWISTIKMTKIQEYQNKRKFLTKFFQSIFRILPKWRSLAKFQRSYYPRKFEKNSKTFGRSLENDWRSGSNNGRISANNATSCPIWSRSPIGPRLPSRRRNRNIKFNSSWSRCQRKRRKRVGCPVLIRLLFLFLYLFIFWR